ncbi:uncharacterized protein ASCRUDRAFT_149787 [Ascoidea rubescens DSM 1968]|uniref:Uncharacterized protein n=1 Tax=Ascoidea rubescens DSM 1968 TaxID=1344418 RepID=A0A1D2VGE0_9ASCO|nr:hypothetical protein ASCRUDRAFT_149787 [Ascoidea rubescens DSM 1968]ODV60734.1 hypothetical protein ASCRUDRAFT_149787 [Ascoidea rubescens DSM 1968]
MRGLAARGVLPLVNEVLVLPLSLVILLLVPLLLLVPILAPVLLPTAILSLLVPAANGPLSAASETKFQIPSPFIRQSHVKKKDKTPKHNKKKFYSFLSLEITFINYRLSLIHHFI